MPLVSCDVDKLLKASSLKFQSLC